ncbi:MAG: hypothetical protein Q4F72_00860 [Desulfovibrionaceae bacterium]|nr:hypothetical protein [Desulfovibrionaceae bacterium]
MNKETRQRIVIEMDDNLPVHYTHGFIGGPNQLNEIEINLYSECEDLPGPADLTLTEDGQVLTDTTYDEPDRARVRTIHTRTVIDAYTARSLARWLYAQADRVDGIAPSDPFDPDADHYYMP